ncbi:MAG: competence protein ComEC family protein, partial [Tenericutes bacterium]|nr:competence protein ComEC family protein [Mycoplasmatota bacterium]
MKKLNLILQFNWFYYLLIAFSLLYSFIYFKMPKISMIDGNNDSFNGIITSLKINGDLLTVEILGNEKIIGNYYFKTEVEKNNFVKDYQLGDKVEVNGTFNKPNNNTVFNLFNYHKYLETKKIYYLMDISSIKKIANNKNIFYKIINLIDKRINTYKSKKYLKAFILGKTDLLDDDIKTNYQELGVSHLLAISGMHISLFSGIILFLLKKCHIGGNISYFITILFLLFYMKLTGNTSSVSRAVILFMLLTFNKMFNFKLSTLKIWCFTFSIIIFKNPYSLV